MSFVDRALTSRFLSALEGITDGQLHLTLPDGKRHHFGQQGPEAELQIKDWSLLPRLALRGDVGLGEGWIAGDWHSDRLETVLAIALRNLGRLGDLGEPRRFERWRMQAVDRVLRLNNRRGSARNIRAHYDVGNEFYQLWLDPGMTYSSALFDEADSAGSEPDLEQAQARKNARILAGLAPGDNLLEIGCGWGGFAEFAAERGRNVTGITLSPSQKGYADARLDGRAELRLQDYRAVTERYDNIVSIEMIEAVGERYWPSYFATLKARLNPGGRVMLQAITVPDAEFSIYRSRSDFIRQHVFPGGMLPCAAMISYHAEQAGLRLVNTFAFGQHYARTCRIWSKRMLAAQARIRGLGYSDAFLRSWQFYLEGCAAAFATQRCDVVQMALAHADEVA